ncbi:MAG: heme peroxidase [Candidatus Binatia bacterium]|nr:MAG: heme peroxidase [Candidatus Binatia bacterium]
MRYVDATVEAKETRTGWPVLHLYYRIDRWRWEGLGANGRTAALEEFAGWMRSRAGEEGLQLVPNAVVGKADLGFMAVHPEARRIQALSQEIAATTFGRCLVPVYSFLSISEATEYVTTPGDYARELVDEKGMDPASPEFAAAVAKFRERMEAYVDARVHPRLPRDFTVLCFYPMRKARTDGRNWYTLPFGERKRLMAGHGETGRRFAHRVTQLITSATGLDDWEWGVTLFARDLASVRDVVYEMRFDPASAVYAEFGPFYVGLRFGPDDLASVLRL